MQARKSAILAAGSTKETPTHETTLSASPEQQDLVLRSRLQVRWPPGSLPPLDLLLPHLVGNHVAVYGAVLYNDADHPPISTYSIDGQTPGIFVPALSQNNSFATFFASPKLADSKHTLEVTVVNDGVPFFLDSILFNATSVSQVTSGGLQPTIIITTIIAPPSETSTALPSKAIADSKSVPVGAIVGGVIGGVVLLVAAILAFYFFYLKPKKSRWNYHVTSVGDFGESPFYL